MVRPARLGTRTRAWARRTAGEPAHAQGHLQDLRPPQTRIERLGLAVVHHALAARCALPGQPPTHSAQPSSGFSELAVGLVPSGEQQRHEAVGTRDEGAPPRRHGLPRCGRARVGPAL